MTRSRLTNLAIAIIAIGIAFRVATYLSRSSLWGDEAMLALNIARRSWSGLLQPLDYVQIAPIPFLLTEWAIVRAFGPGELAFRALPLMAGCLALVLLWPLARRLLSPPAVLLALALAASSTWLVRYSAELKPYAIDTLVATALVIAGFRVRERVTDPTRWATLLVLGTVGVILSMPAMMVGAAVLTALAWDAIVRRDRAVLGVCFGMALVWVAAFLPAYLQWIRPVSQTSYMQAFWQAGFLGPAPLPLAPRWYAALQDTLEPACDWMVEMALTIPALIIIAGGAWRIGRERGPSAVIMLLGPVAIAFAASVAGLFPIASRLMLFVTPLLIVALAGGLEWVTQVLNRHLPSVRSMVLLASLAIPSMGVAARYALRSPVYEEVRPLQAEFARARQAGEPIYVSARVIPAWVYYTTDWTRPDTTRLDRVAGLSAQDGPAFGNSDGRLAATIDETELWWPAREELLGRASGMQGRHWLGYIPEVPPRSWADGEARRMRATARPVVWIILLHPELPESAELLAAVARVGGRADRRVARGEATLYRIRFA